MKRNFLSLILFFLSFSTINSSFVYAEEEDIDILEEELDEEELELKRKREEEEKRRKEEEERRKKEEEERKKREEEERLRQVKARRALEQAKKREENALRESGADTTEYTLNPNSAELLVELEPGGYGFRQRNHRMTLALDADLFFRGRTFLRYDYRFFEYFTIGLMGGTDWSSISLLDKFKKQMNKPSPDQFSILGGLNAKWRLTEWYLRSAVFIEGSFLFGHLWQKLVLQESTHFRIRPGLFLGFDSVFDSGFTITPRIGAEVPIDFGKKNAFKESVDMLLVVGLGFAI